MVHDCRLIHAVGLIALTWKLCPNPLCSESSYSWWTEGEDWRQLRSLTQQHLDQAGQGLEIGCCKRVKGDLMSTWPPKVSLPLTWKSDHWIMHIPYYIESIIQSVWMVHIPTWWCSSSDIDVPESHWGIMMWSFILRPMVETTFPGWQLFHVFLRETMHKHTIWYSVVMLLGFFSMMVKSTLNKI